MQRYKSHSLQISWQSVKKPNGRTGKKDLKEWEDRTDRLSHPEGMRHGTVFEVDRRILEGLRGVE